MSPTTTIALTAYNEHAVLARILLAFSRRRLHIRSLWMEEPPSAEPARLRIETECPEGIAAQLVAQLERIVEVEEARVEPVSTADGRPAILAVTG